MGVIETGFLLVGGTLVFILLAYWASSKYVDFKRKTDSDLSVRNQAKMQENIVSGIILMVLITTAAWLCLATQR